MNDIINKFLLAADKFMPETHLKDLKVGKYSACGSFTRHKDRINKFIQTGDTNYIFKNEIDKACLADDAVYSDFKDMKNRATADKILIDKAYEIAKDPKYYGSQRGLASMVYKCFDKNSNGSDVTKLKSIPQNEQLADELHKPVIRKSKIRKVYSAFKVNIWAANLADIQLITKFRLGFYYVLLIFTANTLGLFF